QVEIERIIDEKWSRRHGKRRHRLYKVRWKGFPPDHDEWLSASALANAPDVLRKWR
ncbi:hypothetical protein K523DRAFT_193587, partial [Schizophyllum commune Tattone D]